MITRIRLAWGLVALWGCETAHAETAFSLEVTAASSPEAVRSSPLANAQQPQAGERAFGGTVVDRVVAGGYTYVAVATADTTRWVATLGVAPAPGVEVRVQSFGAANNFHSRRTNRDFARLLFGTVKPQQ